MQCVPFARIRLALLLVGAVFLFVESDARSAEPPASERDGGQGPSQVADGGPVKKRRILYNHDASDIFCYRPVTAEDVRRRVDEVSGMQVDTFVISPAHGQPMCYPSKVVEMVGQGRDIPPEGGPGDLTVVRNVRSLVAAGHDPIGLVIDRARRNGLEIFVSYRMNEVHGTDKPDSYASSFVLERFWKEHPEWRVGKGKYNDATLDYAVPEVREHMLARVREIIQRYGDRLDGLELDWQRFPSYFKRGEEKEHIPTLTGFVGKVRDMTNACGRRRGRPMLLGARVLPTIERSRAIGLDPVAWANRRLIDFLTVSRFLVNGEGPLDIKGYKQAIANVLVYGSIEVAMARGEDLATPDDYRREARRLWTDGADGIYLFNFFCFRGYGREPPYFLLNELGDPKTIPQ